MSQIKAVGRSAPAMKYDILTALIVLSTHDGGVDGRLAGRLTLLITARFNWQRGSLATGLREIARLWGVTERTAKREMAALKARGWITVRRAAARGRVTEYGLDLTAVLDATRAHWAAVGPDFVARMGAGASEAPGNVVPFQPAGAVQAEGHVGTLWPGAAQRLAAADGATYTAWFARLAEAERTATALTLHAPSKFAAQYIQTHLIGRLLAAVSAEDPSVMTVRVIG